MNDKTLDEEIKSERGLREDDFKFVSGFRERRRRRARERELTGLPATTDFKYYPGDFAVVLYHLVLCGTVGTAAYLLFQNIFSK